jgi:DNA-binding transcriptional ArsR family regulator
MRPLVHPPVQGITVEGILHALSDPTRVAIYARIVAANCPYSCSDLAKLGDREIRREIPKSTLSQHFKILRDAGLIRSERRGVEMQNTSRCAEIDARFPGLIETILKAHKLQSEGRRPASKARARR